MDLLFQYQSQIIDATANGSNVALTLPFGGNPDLDIGMTIADRLVRIPGSHGLVICPDGDRAARLSSRLDGFLSAFDLSLVTVTGPKSQKAPVADDDRRQKVAVVTADTLNRSVLADRNEWGDFLGKTGLVVVDSAQEYRGVLGANIAVLLRRLAHLLSILGAAPPFLVSAAGCANGEELAENLTGKAFTPISSASYPVGKRHFIAVQPRFR